MLYLINSIGKEENVSTSSSWEPSLIDFNEKKLAKKGG